MNNKPEQPNTKKYETALRRLEKARQREAEAWAACKPKGKFLRAAWEEAEENLRKLQEIFNRPAPKRQPEVPLPLP